MALWWGNAINKLADDGDIKRTKTLRIDMKLTAYRIPENELEFTAIRSSGPGGQHVNKVSSAVHLRFDIKASSLPDHCKEKLLQLNDQRITSDGIVVIKARQFRSREKNRQEALNRLERLITRSTRRVKPRKATKPPKSSVRKRIENKKARGKLKSLRGPAGLRD